MQLVGFNTWYWTLKVLEKMEVNRKNGPMQLYTGHFWQFMVKISKIVQQLIEMLLTLYSTRPLMMMQNTTNRTTNFVTTPDWSILLHHCESVISLFPLISLLLASHLIPILEFNSHNIFNFVHLFVFFNLALSKFKLSFLFQLLISFLVFLRRKSDFT